MCTVYMCKPGGLTFATSHKAHNVYTAVTFNSLIFMHIISGYMVLKIIVHI